MATSDGAPAAPHSESFDVVGEVQRLMVENKRLRESLIGWCSWVMLEFPDPESGPHVTAREELEKLNAR